MGTYKKIKIVQTHYKQTVFDFSVKKVVKYYIGSTVTFKPKTINSADLIFNITIIKVAHSYGIILIPNDRRY